MKLELPPQKNLIVTNDEDPLNYYYWPLVGSFYKKRLKEVLRLLGEEKCKNLLDIGFGSGLLFPELSKRCENLYGLEVHDKIGEVEKSMHKVGIKANLQKGSILDMSHEDNFFDVIVSVSTLEHIKDLGRAVSEIKRILKPGGIVVLGFPVRNPLTDLIFRMFGHNPREIHPSSHTDILKAFDKHMEREGLLKLPKFLPMFSCLYVSARFSKK